MLTQQRLKELFTFKDGIFYWAVNKPRVRAGQIAGSLIQRGYWNITIDNKPYYRSNLAWLWTYGEWPNFQIDHINRIRYDDRIENLRLANRSQQNQNRKLLSSNTSGIEGVHWDTKNQKWHSRICVKGKLIHLGRFDEILDAIIARQFAERKYFDAEFYHSG